MLYCERCGAEVEEDAVYCPKCGHLVGEQGEGYIELATWMQRFIALVIDGIILGIIYNFLNIPGFSVLRGVNLHFGVQNVFQFLYFMFMDHYYGQTIGKKVMNLRITKDGGAPLELMDAGIEAFGKVFLLPLDFLIGYFMYREKNQRLFNYLSDTVVIREE
ncbi:MAG: RDD family protein [Candidatus Bathyarchaeota archaeon]|nr:RDD family protein [Candidatus Bathyarchaeota archaeon]